MHKNRLSLASMAAAAAGLMGMAAGSPSALPYRASNRKPRREVQRYGVTEEQRVHNEPIAEARAEKMHAKREARDAIATRYGVSGKTARRMHLERVFA